MAIRLALLLFLLGTASTYAQTYPQFLAPQFVNALGTDQANAATLPAGAVDASYSMQAGTANEGVILPSGTGLVESICNSASSKIAYVYPPVGGSIAGLGTNAGMTIIPGQCETFFAKTATSYAVVTNGLTAP